MAIELISHSIKSVIGFRIKEKIEVEDLNTMVELIEEKLEQQDKLRIYAEINNWAGMSVLAFVKDLRLSLKHFQAFEKEAIISDSKWLKNLAKITNSLFSSIEVKHFDLEDKDQAWDFICS